MAQASSTHPAEPPLSGRYVASALGVFAAGALWSIQGTLMRLMDQSDPWFVLLTRSVAAMGCLIVLLHYLSGGRPLAMMRAAGWSGVAAGIALGVAGASFVLALSLTTIANAVFMIGAGPFFAALLGRWVLGESVRRETWIAMGLSMVGIALMVYNGLGSGRLLGNILGLISVTGFATYSVILRASRQTDMMPAAFYKGAVEGIVALGVIFVPLAWMPNPGPVEVVSVSGKDLFLGLLIGAALALGLFLFTFGSKHLPAAELTLISMGELVLSPVWAWLVVNEVPDPLTLVGGTIIIVAIAYQAVTGARRKRPPRTVV